jgi:hypothetical protein
MEIVVPPSDIPPCCHNVPIQVHESRPLVFFYLFTFHTPQQDASWSGRTQPLCTTRALVAEYDTVTRHDGSSHLSVPSNRRKLVGTVPTPAACFPRFIIQSGRSPPARLEGAPAGLCLIRTARTRYPLETRSLQRLLTLLELRVLQPPACFPVYYQPAAGVLKFSARAAARYHRI